MQKAILFEQPERTMKLMILETLWTEAKTNNKPAHILLVCNFECGKKHLLKFPLFINSFFFVCTKNIKYVCCLVFSISGFTIDSNACVQCISHIYIYQIENIGHKCCWRIEIHILSTNGEDMFAHRYSPACWSGECEFWQ